MDLVDKFRDRDAAKRLAEAIRRVTTPSSTFVEVCGGETHAIIRFRIDALLPDGITLAHGPGCPECATPDWQAGSS